jgi:hypothetical protein
MAGKDKQKQEVKFTFKQQNFVDCYKGNATEAARVAGYKGNDNALAQRGLELVRNSKIKAAIEARNAPAKKKLIADRIERQEFWSTEMRAKNNPLSERRKFSELLGKSEADFTEKIDISGGLEITYNVPEET